MDAVRCPELLTSRSRWRRRFPPTGQATPAAATLEVWSGVGGRRGTNTDRHTHLPAGLSTDRRTRAAGREGTPTARPGRSAPQLPRVARRARWAPRPAWQQYAAGFSGTGTGTPAPPGPPSCPILNVTTFKDEAARRESPWGRDGTAGGLGPCGVTRGGGCTEQPARPHGCGRRPPGRYQRSPPPPRAVAATHTSCAAGSRLASGRTWPQRGLPVTRRNANASSRTAGCADPNGAPTPACSALAAAQALPPCVCVPTKIWTPSHGAPRAPAHWPGRGAVRGSKRRRSARPGPERGGGRLAGASPGSRGQASPLCPRHGFPQLPGRREEGGEGEEYPGGGAVQVGAAARSRGPRGAGEVPPLQSLWDRSETFTALSLGEPGGPGPPSWGGRGLEGRRAASGSGEMELRGVFASTSLPRSPPCHPTAHVTAP